MASAASTTPLRQILEGQLSQLSTEMERLFQEARGRARGELAEQFNQAVRRIRQAATQDELLATLVDAACGFAFGAAVFRVEEGVARGVRIRGLAEEESQAFTDVQIPLAWAAALAGAVESRDPVIAATTEAEVSPRLAELAAQGDQGRAGIFPLLVENHVPALLYAWGDLQAAALELLAQVAAATWMEPETPPADLVTIAPAAVTPPAAERSDEEERLHLKAQRFARVQVAEMRLREAPAVHAGIAQKNLYAALQPRIDAARGAMREKFFETCPGMVDYLHQELVRMLANDHPELLGKDYPGPLA